jgi:formylglycine-generating enzyme required for sulfatase activity
LIVLLVLAGGGGAYWFISRDQPQAPPVDFAMEDEIPDDGEMIDGPETVAPDETVEPDETVPAETITPPVEVASAPPVPKGETFSDSLKAGGHAPTMIWIPAGEFEMGARDSAAQFDERPRHKVSVPAFAMSIHEVTIADYTKFARATGRRAPKTGDLDQASYPVFFVSWNDAVEYSKWLSVQTGKSYRLPTEAEWEYAMRAGSTTAYPWGRKLGRDKAHCFACDTGLDQRRPTKVGRFDANAFGVHDLAGNVEEWVYDCYNKNYQGAPRDGTVFEGGDCSVRVVRGGAYSSGPKALRSSSRNKFQYDSGNDSIGIRIVREP